MKTALLVLAGCVVLAALLFGSCAYFLANPGRAMLGSMQEMEQAGRVFGAETDQRGCEQEALRRQRECDGMSCRIAAGMFTATCFQAAARTPGFCRRVPVPEGLPGPGELRALIAWQTKRCDGLASDELEACAQVAQAVSQTCMAESYEEQFAREDEP